VVGNVDGAVVGIEDVGFMEGDIVGLYVVGLCVVGAIVLGLDVEGELVGNGEGLFVGDSDGYFVGSDVVGNGVGTYDDKIMLEKVPLPRLYG